MRSWRRVFTSEEARIESLAGQSLPEKPDWWKAGFSEKPDDWPMPDSAPTTPPDDEDLEAPDE